MLYNRYFLSYCMALSFFNPVALRGSLANLCKLQAEEYRHQKVFLKGRLACGIFLFTLLLINFLIYNNVYTKLIATSKDVLPEGLSVQMIDSLKRELTIKG